jgi:hypothetical protein
MSSIIVQEFLQNNISIFKQIFIVDLHYTLDQKDMAPVPLLFGK